MTRVRFPAIAGTSFDLVCHKVTLVNHRVRLLAGGGKIRKLAEALHVFVSMLLIVLTGLTGPKLSGQVGSGQVRSVRPVQVRSIESFNQSGQSEAGQSVSQVRSCDDDDDCFRAF